MAGRPRQVPAGSTSMNSVLIIGYGSTLRGDDGVGPRVAERFEQEGLAGVIALARHQLTPELAEPVSLARMVIFVDATITPENGDAVGVTPLRAASAHQVMIHTASPASLLHLAESVFGRCPPAWLVSIPVGRMGIGEELSPLAQRGVEEAVARIKELLRDPG